MLLIAFLMYLVFVVLFPLCVIKYVLVPSLRMEDGKEHLSEVLHVLLRSAKPGGQHISASDIDILSSRLKENSCLPINERSSIKEILKELELKYLEVLPFSRADLIFVGISYFNVSFLDLDLHLLQLPGNA